MKVVLRADVENLGKKGDLCTVADGYARNYLVPRGLAMQATKGVVAQAEAMRRNRDARDRRERDEHDDGEQVGHHRQDLGGHRPDARGLQGEVGPQCEPEDDRAGQRPPRAP